MASWPQRQPPPAQDIIAANWAYGNSAAIQRPQWSGTAAESEDWFHHRRKCREHQVSQRCQQGPLFSEIHRGRRIHSKEGQSPQRGVTWADQWDTWRYGREVQRWRRTRRGTHSEHKQFKSWELVGEKVFDCRVVVQLKQFWRAKRWVCALELSAAGQDEHELASWLVWEWFYVTTSKAIVSQEISFGYQHKTFQLLAV